MKFKAIRWTIEQAAGEFGIDRRTLSNRLRAASIEPGEDAKFSTTQIVAAIHGDLEKERARNEGAAADLREMKRDQARGLLIPREWLTEVLNDVRIALQQVIEGSGLPPAKKREAFENLRKLGETDWTKPKGDPLEDDEEK